MEKEFINGQMAKNILGNSKQIELTAMVRLCILMDQLTKVNGKMECNTVMVNKLVLLED